MTTAIIISELLPLHDDALLADIDAIFDEIDRLIDKTPPDESEELLLIVDELVDEMLDDGDGSDELSIALEVDVGVDVGESKHDEVGEAGEVAEVA